MSFSARMPARMLHELADTHPKLSPVVKRLTDLGIDRQRAVSFARAILTHAVEDFGDAWLGETSRRLKRIDHIRSRISAAVDQVIEHGALPPDLSRPALSGLFDDLQREMDGLKSPLKFADSHPQTPDVARMRGAGEPRAPLPPKHVLPGEPAVGAHPPADPIHLADAAAAMRVKNPDRAALVSRVMKTDGDDLALAILARSDGEQNRLLANVINNHEPPLDLHQQAELRAAVKELGEARGKALDNSGLAAARRAKAVESFPAELRDKTIGDNTVLGPIADSNPRQLLVLWKRWSAGDRKVGFREYVYGEMRAHFRPFQAEFEAAFQTGKQHRLGFLKDPAEYDPAALNKRRVNPRDGGTDLLAMRDDGELWYVDDKSHKAPKKQPGKAIGASSVSAFEENLAANMLADAAEIEAGFARLRAAGHEIDPKALDAARRVRACGEELQSATAGWTDADFALPENQRRVAAILAKPEHRIKLKVTSTMGDVGHVTERLKALGIEVIPPFSAGP